MERWKILEGIEGGAQGDCFIVEDNAAPGKRFFMKKMKEDGNAERRRRFFIETTILRSLSLPGLAKIVDTNSEKHLDKTVPLYYVAELIKGTRLDKFEKSRRLTETDIANLFTQLLTILKGCHEKDVVHRDVKPENIMVLDSGELCLVDFGIAYHENEEQLGKTPVGQELGNRFLRLPEFAAGSLNKRDARSDLTLACGVALYLITGEYPRTLLDHDGNMPHQSGTAFEIIRSMRFASLWNMIFDKGFQHNMASRWNNAQELIDNLQIMTTPKENKTKELEAMLQQHSAALNLGSMEELEKALLIVYNQVRAIAYSILEKIKGFRQEEQKWIYQKGDTERRCQIRSYPIGNKNVYQDLQIVPRAVGEQIVGYIMLDGQEIEVCRCPYGYQFNESELSSIEKIMTDPILENLVKKLGR